MNDYQKYVKGEAFLNSARAGDIADVREYIDLGLDVNFSMGNNSALCSAIDNEKFECAELILQSGGDPNFRNDRGLTPAWFAIKRNDPEMLKLLVDAGAALDEMPLGNSFGMMALKEQSRECFDVLLDIKKGLSAFNQDGESAITYAIKNGMRKEVEMLIDAGVNPSDSIYGVDSPAVLMKERGMDELLERFGHSVISSSSRGVNQSNQEEEQAQEFEIDYSSRPRLRSTISRR